MFFRYPVSPEIQEWIVQNFCWAMAEGVLTAQTPLAVPGDAAQVREETRAALARCVSLPPGGAVMTHHLTELHGVTRGFGLTLLGEEGPLSLAVRAHALAVFLAVRRISAPEVSPRAAKLLARAQVQIHKDPATLEGLRGLF